MNQTSRICAVLLAAAALSACSPKAPETAAEPKAAPESQTAACPTIAVTTAGPVAPSHEVTFTAALESAPEAATYNWSVSAGTITSGQGTSNIVVDAPPGLVTATVEIGGLDASCQSIGSATAEIPAG